MRRTGTAEVINLSDRSKAGEPDAGPAEFISLIDNAAHVVTDSFHAAVLANSQDPLHGIQARGYEQQHILTPRNVDQ